MELGPETTAIPQPTTMGGLCASQLGGIDFANHTGQDTESISSLHLSQEQTVPGPTAGSLDHLMNVFQYTPNSSRRRRNRASLLTRSIATPSHSVQMGRMWMEAHESLERATKTMSSPAKITPNTPKLRSTNAKRKASTSLVEVDWSDHPERAVGLKWNKPLRNTVEFSEDSPFPALPLPTNLRSNEAMCLDLSAAEPMSSGFTSPAITEPSKEKIDPVEMLSTPNMALKKQWSRSTKNGSGSSELLTSNYGIPLPYPMSERGLEERLRDTSISEVDAWLQTVLDEPLPLHPASSAQESTSEQEVERLRTQLEGSSTGTYTKGLSFHGMVDDMDDRDIYVETVRVKLRPSSRADSDKENRQPSSSLVAEVSHGSQHVQRNDSSILQDYRNVEDLVSVRRPSWPRRLSQSRVDSFDSSPFPNPLRSSQPPSDTSIPIATPVRHNTSREISWTPSASMSRLVPTHRTLSSTPNGLFALPPRRKKQKVSPSQTPSHAHTSPTTEVAEDKEVPELSPNVTPFRKGKEPKRTRTASYFDTDILPKLSPLRRGGKGEVDSADESKRIVPVEHPLSTELTREKAFVEEAEGAAFAFGRV